VAVYLSKDEASGVCSRMQHGRICEATFVAMTRTWLAALSGSRQRQPKDDSFFSDAQELAFATYAALAIATTVLSRSGS
jgi:hypothetical protein